jgi:hypothetical protein
VPDPAVTLKRIRVFADITTELSTLITTDDWLEFNTMLPEAIYWLEAGPRAPDKSLFDKSNGTLNGDTHTL